MNSNQSKSIAVIVAHPDDETLWAGGTILSHPTNQWFIVSLCRASDTNRAAKFYKTLKILNAEGIMGDLDDGPTQEPLDEIVLEAAILQLLPDKHFDLIITHSKQGEYTRHLRHEEVNKAVVTLWHDGKISADELWTFAYEDGKKTYFPRAIEKANIYETLPEQTWSKKYKIITETYGYEKGSWEAETTPQSEAFWQFKNSHYAKKSIIKTEKELNIFKTPNLDALKSMYFRSIAYVNDKINWENETSLIAEAFRQFSDSGQANKLLFHPEIELRIFNAPSIEALKSLYYHSIGYVFNKQSWDMELTYLRDSFQHYDHLPNAKESFIQLGKELNIFKKPSIDALKFLYNKSIGYVFKKEIWNFETPIIAKTFRILNKNHRTKKVLDKIGQELQIFNKPSIEHLKLLYTKTGNYLSGPQQQEQPSSI